MYARHKLYTSPGKAGDTVSTSEPGMNALDGSTRSRGQNVGECRSRQIESFWVVLYLVCQSSWLWMCCIHHLEKACRWYSTSEPGMWGEPWMWVLEAGVRMLGNSWEVSKWKSCLGSGMTEHPAGAKILEDSFEVGITWTKIVYQQKHEHQEDGRKWRSLAASRKTTGNHHMRNVREYDDWRRRFVHDRGQWRKVEKR